MDKLKEAREKYRIGEITFKELDKLFYDLASDKEFERYWSSPVYDRPGIIEGKSNSQLDRDWNKVIKQ